MKLFAIFGLICFLDPDIGDKKCFNYWEDPLVKYSLEKCADRAKEIGDQINQEFSENGFAIKEISVWCIPVDKSTES